MKYKVEAARKVKFNPFSVTITIETREEYLHFHDNVLPVLMKGAGSHQLYADVFNSGNGETSEGEGEIKLKL